MIQFLSNSNLSLSITTNIQLYSKSVPPKKALSEKALSYLIHKFPVLKLCLCLLLGCRGAIFTGPSSCRLQVSGIPRGLKSLDQKFKI